MPKKKYEGPYITDGKTKWISEEIKNKYDNSPYRIPLRNKFGIIVEYALVDADDFKKTIKQKWYFAKKKYANGTVDNKTFRMHHYIFKKPKKNYMIDHINQDKLDNRKNNLREVTRSVNEHNKDKNNKFTEKHTSIYKGVCFIKQIKKYSAECSTEGKKINLGYFIEEKDAAIAYDMFTYKYHGVHANNNKLVKYEDVIDMNIDSMIKNKKRTLPLNIRIIDNKYYARKSYNKVEYGKKTPGKLTLREAIIDLENINILINRVKIIEELKYLQVPIKRNKSNIAIITISKIDVLVDDNQWHKLNKMKWHITTEKYIQGSFASMHRLVMKASQDVKIDHINNIRHDNRICNLRIADDSQNGHNKSKSKGASSKYFGVSYCNTRNKWRAMICKNGERFVLGRFSNEIDAAKAYNTRAIELYGSYANLNTF